jgi:hypothetical protein
MNFGDVIAFAALIGGLIAIVAILSGAYMRRLDVRERKLALLSAGKAEDTLRLEERCAELERRLRVLERIVTDTEGSSAVAMQIEALRDSDVREVAAQ